MQIRFLHAKKNFFSVKITVFAVLIFAIKKKLTKCCTELKQIKEFLLTPKIKNMGHFTKGTINFSFIGLNANKLIIELPNSFVGVSDENQSLYDHQMMIKEVYYSEYGNSYLQEISTITHLERISWCYQEVNRLINQYELLLDEDDEILIIDRRHDISLIIECIPNGTRVELTESMIYRRP